MIIQDGTGRGNSVKVDNNNQLHTLAIDISAIERGAFIGNAYNINTGEIGLTSSTESAVLYFKNSEPPVNGESTFIVNAIAIGIDNLGTTSGLSKITLVRNPTAGTIISGASSVAMNVNRNFGSAKTLDSLTLAYKGAEGNTLTDGDDFGIFYQSAGSRGYYSVDIVMPKGSSLGVKIDTQTTAGTTNVYAALIGYRVDGSNEIA